MSEESVGLIDSGAVPIVDGGFASQELCWAMLAGLHPGRRVMASEQSEGSAMSAALLWFEGGSRASGLSLKGITDPAMPGLQEYAKE